MRDARRAASRVSVLYREPKLLKGRAVVAAHQRHKHVSVLYREPKLLKVSDTAGTITEAAGFSALP